jgi:hypothetical protein
VESVEEVVAVEIMPMAEKADMVVAEEGEALMALLVPAVILMHQMELFRMLLTMAVEVAVVVMPKE